MKTLFTLLCKIWDLVPKVALAYALAVCVSYFFCWVYQERGGNPMNAFYLDADKKCVEWARSLAPLHQSKYVFSGTSMTKTSIVPSLLLEEFNIASINLGQTAGMGGGCILERSFDFLLPGDTLVIEGISPDFKYKTTSGLQYLVGVKGMYARYLYLDVSLSERLTAMSPGLMFFGYSLGKYYWGKDPYRYKMADTQKDGWQLVPLNYSYKGEAYPARFTDAKKLSPSSRASLMRLKQYCHSKKINLVLSPCVSYSVNAETSRRCLAYTLIDVVDIIPVVKDSFLGANPSLKDYSDSVLHLTPEGAKNRTREIGKSLTSRQFWTKEELIDIAEGRKTL